MQIALTFLIRSALAWLAMVMCPGVLLGQNAAAALSPDRVTFYTEPNYKGEALAVEAGAAVENLATMTRSNQRPWAFAISSVRVDGNARATVFTSAGFSGERLEITASLTDLYAVHRGREGSATWDRSIASVTVTGPQRVAPQPVIRYEEPPPTVYVVPSPSSRPPPPVVREERPRMDRRTAELMVQRAFREVLGRPADPDGLRTYRDRIIFEGWTEQQVIQQLQRSGEARGVNPDEAIAKAYREVLGRAPDPHGLAHYRSKWREGWTQGQIRDDLRRSHEGRNSHIHSTITRAYRELLGRDPDPAGFANYERGMRERGWTEQDVRRNLMSSEEYRQSRKR